MNIMVTTKESVNSPDITHLNDPILIIILISQILTSKLMFMTRIMFHYLST